MTTKTAPLTVDDIEAGYEAEWLGYGYLGERERATRTRAGSARVQKVEARLLAVVNDAGWTPVHLFLWMNSKQGRWFGEEALGLGAGAIIDRAFARYVNLAGL